MKKIFLFIGCACMLWACSQKFRVAGISPSAKLRADQTDLSGKWEFRADPADAGIQEKWFNRQYNEHVNLPGSMTTNGKGDDVTVVTKWTGSIFDSAYFVKPEYGKYRRKGSIKVPFWLQPEKHFVGAAWYQREISVSDLAEGSSLRLVLERPHFITKVWIDDRYAGMQNSLSTSHVYNLGNLVTAGKHRLTIRVDNRIDSLNPGPNSHSVTDHTQTNWNGIVGSIYLEQVPEITFGSIRIDPDIAGKRVKINAHIINNGTTSRSVELTAIALPASKDVAGPLKASWSESLRPGVNVIERWYDMGSAPRLWSEFSPELYRLRVTLNNSGSTALSEVQFGMREVAAKGRAITINGTPVFLRGALECAIFPKTGYPATDSLSWANIFKVVKSYGLNHIRFHSWCPPEAAFNAADIAGVYLQVECGSWPNWGTSLGDGNPIDQYLYDESDRIMRDYGNHPSFIILTHGNEPGGRNHTAYLKKFTTFWKEKDSRRLHVAGANWPIIEENEFQNIAAPRIQAWEEGLKSVINRLPPASEYDWRSTINKYDVPVVSHEIGQWCVYPDLKEISQYTGVLKAKNFEIFRERLEDHHLLYLADSFLLASGKLQALCYKAEIEAALRTPGMSGFQLLGLQDFPGQGTALVGVVNPFWGDKGYISPEEYRQFSNTVVPLARFAAINVSNDQILNVPIEVANFNGKPLSRPESVWSIRNVKGVTLFRGQFPTNDIPIGSAIKVGTIRQDLSSVESAEKLTLSVTVAGFTNSWDFFVYPSRLPEFKSDVLITAKFDDQAIKTLSGGGKVLLSLPKGSIKPEMGGNIAVGFSSIFWNTAWTNGQAPHTLGVLCDPRNPALAYFPADFHSNWQWWDAMSHSDAMILDSLSKDIKPIVRVIDDWVTARDLGLVFECRVGKGKLLVSSIDLLRADRSLESKQLLYSLEKYVSSPSWNPKVAIDAEKISGLLKN